MEKVDKNVKKNGKVSRPLYKNGQVLCYSTSLLLLAPLLMTSLKRLQHTSYYALSRGPASNGFRDTHCLQISVVQVE